MAGVLLARPLRSESRVKFTIPRDLSSASISDMLEQALTATSIFLADPRVQIEPRTGMFERMAGR